MKRILAISGSNSPKSINTKLISKVASMAELSSIAILDLNLYDIPMYNQGLEEEQGIPQDVLRLKKDLSNADGYIIATPEHNGFTSAFFKNILDWLSRTDRKVFGDKPTLLLSASPGPRAGQFVRDALGSLLPRWGAQLTNNYGVGEFYKKTEDQQWEEETLNELSQLVINLEEHLVKAEVE